MCLTAQGGMIWNKPITIFDYLDMKYNKPTTRM